jgi:hypothetical protein
MGKKSQPSITSGGIGVTQEITNVGGLSVTVGGSIDISPIDLGINYDPSNNSLGIAGGAEIPGGLLGASGGVTIDLNTGQVIGGSIGGEALGLGVNVSASKDGGLGVEFTVQIPFTPIEFSVGLGYSPKKGKGKPSAQIEDISKENKGFGSNSSSWPSFKPNCYYTMIMVLLGREGNYEDCLGYSSGDGSFGYSFKKIYAIDSYSQVMTGFTYNSDYRNYEATIKEKPVLGSVFTRSSGWIYVVKGDLGRSDSPNGGSGVEKGLTVVRLGGYAKTTVSGMGNTDWKKAFQGALDFYNNGRMDYTSYLFIPLESCPNEPPNTPILDNSNNSSPPNSSPSSSPFPNPPPRRRNMNECCRDSIKLQRLIVRHLGAARSSGQENLPSGVREIGSTQEGIRQSYPFVVKKRWVDPNAKDSEGIPILNDRQLALVIGGMLERIEQVLGTSEFYKDSEKKLRQSEGNMLSWLTGKNKDFRYPDPNDFWLNTDDGVINEKTLEVRSIADGLRYQIEALNRPLP